MKCVYFSTTDITNQRRISLSPALMKNLELQVGDSLELFMDAETHEIVLCKAGTGAVKRKKRASSRR